MATPPIHRRLKIATSGLHDLVDRQAEALDLSTPPGLRGFLEMMAQGLGAVERGLERSGVAAIYPLWPTRTRLKLALEELGRPADEVADDAVPFTHEAEQWGALYVLEGSRLGSRVLARQAPGCRFLQASADDRMWPSFLDRLGAAHARLNDAQRTIGGAEKAFRAFL